MTKRNFAVEIEAARAKCEATFERLGLAYGNLHAASTMAEIDGAIAAHNCAQTDYQTAVSAEAALLFARAQEKE